MAKSQGLMILSVNERKELARATTLASVHVRNELMMLRSQMLSKLLDGKKDINGECGYPENPSIDNYRMLYEREGTASRVVAVLPEESWAVEPEVYEVEDEENTDFEIAWKALADSQSILHYLERVDILSGIGHYGILLLGIDDGKPLDQSVAGVGPDGKTVKKPDAPKPLKQKPAPSTTEPPTEPVTNETMVLTPSPTQEDDTAEIINPEDMVPEGGHKLTYIRAFPEYQATIARYDTDQTSVRFGQPIEYNVKFHDPNNMSASPSGASPVTDMKVHWHRVIHVADNRESSEVWGRPRLRNTYNRCFDIRKIMSGSGEMFWKGAFPGLSFEVTPEAAGMGVELDPVEMKEQFEKYSNGLQRYLALVGVSAKSLAPQIASPKDHLEAELQQIALTIGMPLRKFLGSEAAHLASTQDSEDWNKKLRRRQTRYLTPMVIRPFVDRLIAFGCLPIPSGEGIDGDEELTPGGYHVDWPDLSAPSDDQVAGTAQKFTAAITQYVSGGCATLIPPLEFLTMILHFTTEEAQSIIDAAGDTIDSLTDAEDPLNPAYVPPPPPVVVAPGSAKDPATLKKATGAKGPMGKGAGAMKGKKKPGAK